MLRHPEIAVRPCDVCLKYLFNEETHKVEYGRDGKPEERYFACPPLCRTEKGCPKGTAEQQKSLNAINEICYEHYRECRAVGQFPDDPIVRRNAAIIRAVEDRFEEYQKMKSQSELVQLLIAK